MTMGEIWEAGSGSGWTMGNMSGKSGNQGDGRRAGKEELEWPVQISKE